MMSVSAKKLGSNRREFITGKAALRGAGDTSPHEIAGESSPHGESESPAYLWQLARRAMACEFEVFFDAHRYPAATSSAMAALDVITALERQMTVFDEESELSRINREAAAGPVAVAAELFDLLRLSVQLHEETDRAFDISASPLWRVWGFHRREGRIPSAQELATALAKVGSHHLRLDAKRRTVRFVADEMELNLGSIGKGYALDRAAEAMQRQGVRDALWHGGKSSILACGSAPDGGPGWKVGIANPLRRGKRLGEIRLIDRGLATSGTAKQFFRHNGKRYGHILDPRTGWPAEAVYSVTVVASTATLADALSTAFYVMGPDRARQYCRDHPKVGLVMVYPRAGRSSAGVVTANLDQEEFDLQGPP